MIFTSFEFLAFFGAILLVRCFLKSFVVEKWFLLIASYLFYMSWSVPCVLLILFSSLVDFWVGARLGNTEGASPRKRLLMVSLVCNLGLLGFFKYTNFFIDSAGSGLGMLGVDVDPGTLGIILPVGISFFTFQSMSYTIDIYRRQLEPTRNMRDFLLYVSFFPQLVAGPIVRAARFLPQLQHRTRASALDFEIGLTQFGVGAVKKLVISDQIGPHVNLIFATPGGFDAFTLLQGVLGFAVMIYCDFSGYSDMAIGAARMMGFRFPPNFKMPYSAVTITEFWRRWHISLSTWLRDYLYIPLGGNRDGTRRMYRNLLITMLLGGLWHGASWNFVIWGGLHGAALAVHKIWMTWCPLARRERGPLLRLLGNLSSRGLTLGVVLLAWIFFRAETWGLAMEYLTRLVTWSGDGTRLVSPYILPAVAAVAFMHIVVDKDRAWMEEIPTKGPVIRVAAYSCLALLLVCFAATDSAPFIYFQF